MRSAKMAADSITFFPFLEEIGEVKFGFPTSAKNIIVGNTAPCVKSPRRTAHDVRHFVIWDTTRDCAADCHLLPRRETHVIDQKVFNPRCGWSIGSFQD